MADIGDCKMGNFPGFMKNPLNAIKASQQSSGVEGYVFDGADVGQMAFWECSVSGVSNEHVHDYDEYFVVVEGEYSLFINNQKYELKSGNEFFIPKGIPHSGTFIKGTRTIHAFGGKRADRELDKDK